MKLTKCPMPGPSSSQRKIEFSERELYLIKRALVSDNNTLDRTLNRVGESPISEFQYKELVKYWLDEKKSINELLKKLEAVPPKT